MCLAARIRSALEPQSRPDHRVGRLAIARRLATVLPRAVATVLINQSQGYIGQWAAGDALERAGKLISDARAREPTSEGVLVGAVGLLDDQLSLATHRTLAPTTRISDTGGGRI
jgi:hypothetical protein